MKQKAQTTTTINGMNIFCTQAILSEGHEEF